MRFIGTVHLRAAPASPGTRALPAALGGILAAACGLAAAELVAQAVPSGVSFVVAVGDRVIALAPPWLKDTAISLLGTRDKPALLTGTVVLLLAAAAGVGLLARRSPRAAYAGVGVLVLVGLLAALREPRAGVGAAIATAVVATAVGCAALRRLVARPLHDRPARPPALQEGRREFLVAAGLIGAGTVASLWGARLLQARRSVSELRAAIRLPRPAVPAAPLPAGARLDVRGISPLITPNADFYRIDTALLVPQVDVRDWRLAVTGRVRTPRSWSYEDLLAMPQTESDITISCVSNEVGGALVGSARWQGVLLTDLLDLAGVEPGATQVVGISVDDFTAGFPTATGTDGRAAMVALGMNGEPLPVAHGFPARLVVPGLYGYVSATKWLREISLTTQEEFDGYWVPRGWSKLGPVKTESRIDVPVSGSGLRAGPIEVAGVAWAPHRGISAVEIRVDDGPWERATLSAQTVPDLWRQWRWTWDASPGSHTLRVRATDGTGAVQTGRHAPPAPDGASGWHAVDVSVNS